MVKLLKVEKQAKSAGLSSVESASKEQIAIAAYYCAEKRGFLPGAELADWLEAEYSVTGGH